MKQSGLGRVPVGYFTDGSPTPDKAGVLSNPRDLAWAKRLVAESAYKDEPILLMSPTDQPSLQQESQLTRSLFQELGLNVEFMAMDWGSLVPLRANSSLRKARSTAPTMVRCAGSRFPAAFVCAIQQRAFEVVRSIPLVRCPSYSVPQQHHRHR